MAGSDLSETQARQRRKGMHAMAGSDLSEIQARQRTKVDCAYDLTRYVCSTSSFVRSC